MSRLLRKEAGYLVCSSCGYMSSDDKPSPGADVEGVEPIREKNFRIILGLLRERHGALKTILDVGCSDGLFIKTARDDGYDATGLEPDLPKANAARAKGLPVIDGFFPDAPGLFGRTFDVIIFNDSFEHIPNPARTIGGIKRHLTGGGAAVINVPSSGGIVFKISLLLAGLGIPSPLYRLWQRGFSSPHLHYFNKHNIELLFRNNGFEPSCRADLDYYAISGLWKRVRYKTSIPKSAVICSGLLALYPFSKMMSDVSLSFFTRKEI
ncbi:hypothetical protein FACS1894167_08010 [Synergistales bacterium]|nr:hypothetical protein FACS1894167_08010 [Synergistales bacterium]GHV53499.1 hypothetical protein FACS1894216_11610 [Synergistales bacterium]